jgi:hypothetical protein
VTNERLSIVERNVPAEVRHWFFQTLDKEQREGFFKALGFGCEVPLGTQYQVLERVVCPEAADTIEELVEELSRARAYLCVSEAATDSTTRPLYTKDDLCQRIRAITALLTKLGDAS